MKIKKRKNIEKDLSDEVLKKEKKQEKVRKGKFKPTPELIEEDNQLKYILDQMISVDRSKLPKEVQSWLKQAQLEISHMYYCLNMDLREYFRNRISAE